MPDTAEISDKKRNARLEARVPSDQKEFFQRAATLAGRTLSEFVIDSTQKAAAKVIGARTYPFVARGANCLRICLAQSR